MGRVRATARCTPDADPVHSRSAVVDDLAMSVREFGDDDDAVNLTWLAALALLDLNDA
jgi:hypothetical protein